MTQDEIIEMAKQVGIRGPVIDFHKNELEAFAKLVAEKEREKSLKLWMLLDDVDTADDIAKADDAIYRSLCRQAHKKRWNVLTGDDVDNATRARGQA
jgi:uncharacterized protein (UPF0216 family)